MFSKKVPILLPNLLEQEVNHCLQDDLNKVKTS